jgi:crotonobetainyl-CoA:carnitine CoA-transferase CaiB-like acyl-CoA transferase
MTSLGALAGVQVVDLSQLLPGPMATHMLQEYGAQVTRVQAPGHANPTQALNPLPSTQTGAVFNATQRNKALWPLNLKDPHDRGLLIERLARTDVLVEGFRPGVMQRLGLEPHALCNQFPRLIVCSITGYGQHGDWAMHPGHDLNYQAISGLLHDPSTDQMHMPPRLWADLVGGAMSASLAISMALIERARTGKGRWIDLSITDAVRSMNALQAAQHWGGGMLHQQASRYSGEHPGYRLYGTSDQRQIACAALEHKFWIELCEALQRPDLAMADQPEQWATAHHALEAIFSAQPQAFWTALALEKKLCITPALRIEEALSPGWIGETQAVAVRSLAGEAKVLRAIPDSAQQPHSDPEGLLQ